jgi:hypothetical protein
MASPRTTDVITDFLEAARTGDADESYDRDELRSLRSALSHVDADLGERPIDAVGDGDVRALVDGLRAAGLPPARLDGVIDALHALFSYALRRGIVRTSPALGVTRPSFEPPRPPEEPVRVPAEPDPVEPPLTPTYDLLRLGDTVARWTARVVVLTLVVVAAALILALS